MMSAPHENLHGDHHANAICCGFARGTCVADLAKRHGVSASLVHDVLAGRRYGEVTGRGMPLPSSRVNL